VTYGLLHGSHEISIDEKGRMLVPAAIRNAIISEREASVFVVLGQNNKIWLYPDKYYEELVKREQPELLPADASLDFDHLTFSTAHRIPVDKQCRVLLPDLLMKYTGTQNAVTIIGSRDHAEVWNRSDFFAHLDDLRQRRKEISDAKRKSSVQESPA
jgi:MraZ protein